MTAAVVERAEPAATTGTDVVVRLAATGSPVELSLPTAFGGFRWYGSTRITGPRTACRFLLAPAAEHRAIPTTTMPGARETRHSVRGHDVVLFESPDRRGAALVFAGPRHEATTWFGGPAPDAATLSRLVSTLTFTDCADGATLVPVCGVLAEQSGTTLIGRSPTAMLTVRRAVEALPMLPDWAGLAVTGGELWRSERRLDPVRAAGVAGTPHRWRFLLAGPTAVTELVLLGPESGRPPTPLDDDQLMDTLDALGAHWAG
jgi:hypothetical protein